VDDVGAALEGHKPRGASVLVHVFRLLLLGGAMFAILRVYKASPNSLCVGLLVPVVSITLEALYEWIYARA
jgi:heme/copper-type cytochrome/quinol oxidase subunit 1